MTGSLSATLLSYRDGARVYAGTHATGPNTSLRRTIRQGEYPHLAEAQEHLTEVDMTELFEQGIRLLTAELP